MEGRGEENSLLAYLRLAKYGLLPLLKMKEDVLKRKEGDDF